VTLVGRSRAVRALLGLASIGAALGVHERRLRGRPQLRTLQELHAPVSGVESMVRTADGTELRVVVAGRGPAVVLLHSFALDADQWNLLTPLLVEQGYRVVAYDQRGFGRSTLGRDGLSGTGLVGDLLAVLEHLDLTDVVLVGHSLGGFIAASALARSDAIRKRTAGAVLVGALVGQTYRRTPQNRLQVPLIRSGVTKNVARHGPTGRFLGAFMCGRDCPWALAERCRAIWSNLRPEFVPILEDLVRDDLRPELELVTVPVVVMTGDADRAAPRWQTRAFEAGLPTSRTVVVARAGHMLNWEAPEAIAEAVASLHASA
jgi:pimeloyl-ACP methyl ester carboxylesterase